jgi:hypothetical protein
LPGTGESPGQFTSLTFTAAAMQFLLKQGFVFRTAFSCRASHNWLNRVSVQFLAVTIVIIFPSEAVKPVSMLLFDIYFPRNIQVTKSQL